MYTLRLSCFWSLTNYQRVQGDWSPRACSLGRSGFVIITVSGFGRHLTAASQFHSYCCSKADWVSIMQWRKEDNHFTVIHHNFKGSLMDSKAVNKPYSASVSKLRVNVERFNFKSLSLFSDSEWIISEYHSRISFSKFKVKLILHSCQFLNHTRIEMV